MEAFYYVIPDAMENPLENLLETLDINMDKSPQEKSSTKGESQKEEPPTADPIGVLESDNTGEPLKEPLQN